MLKVASAAALLVGASAQSTQITAVDIVNFALNLECLEAEFYSWAVYGKGLSDELLGGGPASIGGMKANLTAFDASPSAVGAAGIAKELADDEIAHVAFLRAALGDAAVACPKMDVGPAFAAAASAAAGVDMLSPTFDPYANDLFFLHGAFIFEDVGVTAYNGAVAPVAALAPTPILQAAASILGTEAYHAGAIRTYLQFANKTSTTPYGPVTAVVQLISDLRDSVDGPSDDDQGIVKNGALNAVPTDANGLVYARTIPNVLNIVYLGGEESGGFYPQGINGVFGEMSRAETEAALADLAASLGMGAGADAAMGPMSDMMTGGDMSGSPMSDMMMPGMAPAMCPPCPGCAGESPAPGGYGSGIDDMAGMPSMA